MTQKYENGCTKQTFLQTLQPQKCRQDKHKVTICITDTALATLNSSQHNKTSTTLFLCLVT